MYLNASRFNNFIKFPILSALHHFLSGFFIMEMEIWRDIPNYNGEYQVSNLGRVKSLKFGKERLFNGSLDISGYIKVTLNRKTFKVHQLVAIAFLNHRPCGRYFVVNHKNFIKTDNRLENIEIVTMRENSNRKHLPSTSKYTGVSSNKSKNKWYSNIVVNGKQIYLGAFDSEIEASEYYENALKSHLNNNEIKIKRLRKKRK